MTYGMTNEKSELANEVMDLSREIFKTEKMIAAEENDIIKKSLEIVLIVRKEQYAQAELNMRRAI